ncbi:MAG: carboxypeptidase-like regulatory domain-containing protein [Bryobacteraceae bacterium]
MAFSILLAAPAVAEKKPKKQAVSEAYSVIVGTVYRPPGFALPGAEVEITPEVDGKPKKMKAVSDSRGEFAVRVPVVPIKYKVDVKMNGYQPQQQTVAIEGEQRKELSFQLEPVIK